MCKTGCEHGNGKCGADDGVCEGICIESEKGRRRVAARRNGCGKTVFVKGLAQGLGIEDEITSPTYAYMNDYDGKLYHYDCYRLRDGAQAEALGLCDYFYADGICVIEWPQNIEDVLPQNCKVVEIRKLDANKREILCE